MRTRTDSCVAPSSGYVQGMSDLLSPILYVMENEVDAFWCFVSFMDQMVSCVSFMGVVAMSCRSAPTVSCSPCVCVQHQNFEEQMQGMKTQLIQLSTLLRLLDLAFWNYLGMNITGPPTGCLSALRFPLTSPRFSSRVSGLGLLVLLLPLAADQVQEGAQLHGRAAALGGEFAGAAALAEFQFRVCILSECACFEGWKNPTSTEMSQSSLRHISWLLSCSCPDITQYPWPTP